jgi:NAD(P)-dependent dehydrogenase (short-subunit alcohol dehydrogenase family)
MTSKASYPSLAGRTALVTGGASGIGAAIVRGFVRNGAKVAVLDVQRDAGEALAAELGGDVVYLHCDLTDIEALRAAVAEAERRLGPIQALVNNAANDTRHTFEELTPEDWDASQDVNLKQQVFMAQAVLAGMRSAGGGSIVNLSSTAALWGAPNMIPYVAAKSAVIGFSRALGRTIGEHGIRVNAVAPGGVMTERQMRLWHTPETKAAMVARQSIHEDLLEEHIADAVLFLSADDSRMITMQLLAVEGGSL